MNRSSSKRERVSSGKAAMLAGLLFVLPGALGLQATTSPALAVDIFSDWTNAVDGDWELDANWTPVVVPNNFDNSGDSYFVTITASGSPFTINMNSFIGLSDLVLNSPDVTLSLQPGANALNIGPPGGITVTQGTLSFDGGAAFVPFINVTSPAQFVFNTGFVGINGNSQVIGLDGTSLFNDLYLGPSQNLLVQAADGSFTSGINLTAGNTLTIDGGALWVNLLQTNGGTLIFNEGALDIDNPFDTFIIGPSGPFAGDFTNTWYRQLRHTGTVAVENGATLTLESGSLRIGSMDLSAGGTFIWQDGQLELLSDILIQDGNTTAPFFSGQELENGQYFKTTGNLTVGDTFFGEFTLGGWNQSEVDDDVFIGRQFGSDGSVLNVGSTNSGNSSNLRVMGDTFVGGDGLTEGGGSELNIGPYSYFTTEGLLYIHSSSSVSVTEYSYLTAGRIIREGSFNLSDAYITLTDTFELIVDDNYDNMNGPTESNPFGSNISIGDFFGGGGEEGGSSGNLRELRVNNFMAVGANGGNGSLIVQGDGKLIVGNVLTFGAGANVLIDMYSGYYGGGGLIEANDVNTFGANPANLQFRNANFQLNLSNSLVIDPSAYQFGSEVYVDGSFQREDPNNLGNFIDYNFNYINVPNGQIIVGNTGYGKLVVSNYTHGVESQFMIIGGNAPGADGEVEVRNSNQQYNNEFGNYLYQGIRVNSSLLLGVYDLPITQNLLISDYGGVSVGDQLTVGSALSTNGTLTGELIQQNYSDLTVGGVFTVNQFGRYRGEFGGTLAVGSFNVHSNADFSVFGIGLIIGNDDLTIAAGELFGDTVLVDPRGSYYHFEDPAVTLLTRLQIRNGDLNIGASFGSLTIQDPDSYYGYYDANVDVSGTTTVANGAELHILDRGSLRTGWLSVQPGGIFNWEDGYLELTSSGLLIDSVAGDLPIGDTVIIDQFGPSPSRRGLRVAGNVIIGEFGQGTLDIKDGSVHFDSMLRLGAGTGSQGTVILGDPGQFNYPSLFVFSDIELGGSMTGSFNATSALLEVHPNGNLSSLGVIRIWDNHQVIFHGGTISVEDIVKDDGNGTFSPSNFQFTAGTLSLNDANLTLDDGKLLGNFVELVNGKNLYVDSRPVYDPNTGTFTYPTGLTTVKSGSTLQINGGIFRTRRLLVEAGGTFTLLGGNFQLTADDLIIDPLTGQLAQLVNPGNTSIQVTNGKLIVGDVDFGLMDLGSGFVSSRGAQFGRNPGSTFTASVGKPDGSVFNSISNYTNSNDELVLGGTSTAAGGTGTFTIHPNASVDYRFANLRIWNGSRMILDGGFLRVNDILKDDGSGTFTHGPTPDFTFNAGSLFLRTNQTLDTNTALGNNLTLGGNKLLDIAAQLTINNGAALTLSGGTLSVNQLEKVGTGTFAFTSGTLNLRNQSATVDSLNPSFFLGGNFTFGANTRINLTNSAFNFVVGESGTGTATFNGGPLNNAFAGGQANIAGQIFVGQNAGSNGTLNVGDGTSTGYFAATGFSNNTHIGAGGIGNLNVLAGSRADFRRLFVGSGVGSNGTVTINGNNSSINISTTAFLGGDATNAGGSANVYVQNGGSFNVFNNNVTFYSGGNLYIQGGSAYMASVTNLGGRIHYTNGLLRVNNQGLTVGPNQLLGAAVTIPALSTISVGFNSPTLGIFTIANGGSLANHGNLDAGSVNIENGGTLSGNGVVRPVNSFVFHSGSIGLRVENAGTLAPGASAGIFTINGSFYGTRYTQTATGELVIEIGGNANGAPVAGTHYDQLIVHGNLFLDGTLDLVGLAGAAIGQLSDVYQIIRYTGSRTGTFANINWSDGFVGTINYDVNVGGGWKAVTISQIPEPTTMLLLTLGGTMLLGRRSTPKARG